MQETGDNCQGYAQKQVAGWLLLLMGILLVGCIPSGVGRYSSPIPLAKSPLGQASATPPALQTVEPVTLPSPSCTPTRMASERLQTPAIHLETPAPLSEVLHTSIWDKPTCEENINSYLPPGQPFTPSVFVSLPSQSPEPVPVPSHEQVLELSGISRLDGYVLDLVDKWKGGGLDDLRGLLQRQNLLCDSDAGGCPSVVAYDLDADSVPEYVFVASLKRAQCGNYVATQEVYILDCQPSPRYCRVYRVSRPGKFFPEGACINGIDDVNLDRRPDIVVTYHSCGAADCWNTLELVSWQPQQGYIYIAPTIRVHDGCLAIRDQDGDGVKEILASHTSRPGYAGGNYDTAGNPLFGPVGAYLSLFYWDGSRYTLADRFYGEHRCQFQYIWEGIERVQMGQIERARQVFETILTEEIPVSCGVEADDVEFFYWQAYAQYAVGVLSARLGERKDAIGALQRVHNLDPEGIFSPLADVFLKAYSEVNDYVLACKAVTAYVEHLPSDAPFRGPFPANPLTTMCSGDLSR